MPGRIRCWWISAAPCPGLQEERITLALGRVVVRWTVKREPGREVNSREPSRFGGPDLAPGGLPVGIRGTRLDPPGGISAPPRLPGLERPVDQARGGCGNAVAGRHRGPCLVQPPIGPCAAGR